MRVFGIVRGVIFIECKANGAGNFDGHFPHFYVDAERVERGHEFFIESGDGARNEMERSGFAEAGLDFENMIDEIEVDFENAFFVRDWRCGETAGGDVESGTPPMVCWGTEGQPDLPADLLPHLQVSVDALPFGPSK